jgi:chaperonin cofactor prefoldin
MAMTVLEENMARAWAAIGELAESHKETERVLKEAERAREEAECARKETERFIREAAAEAKQRSIEADKRLDKLERNVDRVTKQMGGIHNSIGEIVELIIVPGLRKKMNRLEHNFTVSSPRKTFSGPNGSTLTEVDLLLENGEAVMAVEVKRHLTVKWVDCHLTRLGLLRKHERITGITGKAMYAAVAGMRIDADARALAEGNGMYIIDVEEDTERLRVVKPMEPAVW